MIKKIDLHTHSTASDGTFTPSEVAHKAHKTGLSAVALTDHDTINGLAESNVLAVNTELRVYPALK